jgi:ribosome-binding protein aMBF1 (putative translation factor)
VSFPDEIRKALRVRGWSQRIAAEKLGVAESTIQRWCCRGPNGRFPTRPLAKKIFETLGLRVPIHVSVQKSSRMLNGNPIRHGRLRKHWSQARLAREIGAERSAVCQWEHGKWLPSAQFAVQLNRILDIKLPVKREVPPKGGKGTSIIWERRIALGLKQRQIADFMKVSVSAICRWEKAGAVPKRQRAALCTILRVEPGAIPLSDALRPSEVPPPAPFDHTLCHARYRKTLSRDKLAKTVGMSARRIHKFEQFVAWPTRKEAEKIAAVLEVSVSSILSGDPEE